MGSGHNLLKPNLLFLHLYAFSLGIGAWQTGWALAGYSPAAKIFEAKFGWDADQTKFWTSVINTAGIVGTTIGALAGGMAISVGRRKAGLLW